MGIGLFDGYFEIIFDNADLSKQGKLGKSARLKIGNYNGLKSILPIFNNLISVSWN